MSQGLAGLLECSVPGKVERYLFLSDLNMVSKRTWIWLDCPSNLDFSIVDQALKTVISPGEPAINWLKLLYLPVFSVQKLGCLSRLLSR